MRSIRSLPARGKNGLRVAHSRVTEFGVLARAPDDARSSIAHLIVALQVVTEKAFAAIA
jgi:hypothetical protein